MKKIMLLGSGELGKEVIISAQRLGCEVIAVDRYENAPGMQVADKFEVINMLDHVELLNCIKKHNPDLIVPEIEAIRTEALLEIEKEGTTVIPTARAANLTMNRDKIRDLAKSIGLPTAKFQYAENINDFTKAVEEIGIPCVVKPVMSSSGKGQSTINEVSDIEKSWNYAIEGARGDRVRVIVEEFISFDYEITLLTVKQKTGPTVFCPPIGHFQERGDYQYSWQPQDMSKEAINQSQKIAKKITDELGGMGIFGVEFFIKDNKVIFSELSPRPHDTGMVTMKTQRLSEFDLHVRAFLQLPITQNMIDDNFNKGASHVVLADQEGKVHSYEGIEEALMDDNIDIRIFGKSNARKYRRMAVVLSPSLDKAKIAAKKIKVIVK
ncbi:MAG: Phosphoribosylglycinamide formyltransferase 2 [Alphaproteobacteria bacterium MarineAlpha9_Bin3]|nr:MAG: Phosphoribosylglycinamide formyltransferase 2 [Alphaproteobacteria bacterium MarineAlpha9_Bin3]|tara:strand:+ start:15083 stop:16225 length:1143 start_codon:yes stop_codon:yes gene_type:complete